MEVPWQNCFSDLDMDEINFFNQSHKTYSFDDDEEFLREIFRQPSFSSESDSTHSSSIQNNPVTAASDPGGGIAAAVTATNPSVNSLSLDNNDSSGSGSQLKRNSSSSSSIASKRGNLSDKPVVISSSSSPSTYILSFDNSAVLPATSDVDGYRKHDESSLKSGNQEKLASSSGGGGGGIRASQKRTLENHNSDHQPKANQGTKKTRSSSESLDHIMAERKRRQELTEKFIALSATIPGLKKIDKASILSEAIIHVKQLKERVRELEEQNKKMMSNNMEQSVSYMKKKKKKKKSSSSSPSLPRQDNIEDTTTTSCEIMSSDNYFKISESLPEVEARVLQRQVLIRIHCENEKGVIINLLAQLHGLHFSIISDSVLPFGNSTLDITIIAEVDEEHKIAVKELVKKLRMTLLKSAD